MTDQPRYGEYATPEEQRRLAGLPPEDAIIAPTPPAPAGTGAEAAAGRRPADRVVTIVLLGYGLINVVLTAISYLDLPSVMDQVMQILGVEGDFTNLDAARLWGGIAAAVLVIGYAWTAFAAIRRMRRGRLSWWIPLVGAAVTMIIVSICVAIPMAGDPAFAQFLRTGGA